MNNVAWFVGLCQKNDKVQKLEDECDWYRKEALRLDGFNTAMKKDLKYMKEKMETLGAYIDSRLMADDSKVYGMHTNWLYHAQVSQPQNSYVRIVPILP